MRTGPPDWPDPSMVTLRVRAGSADVGWMRGAPPVIAKAMRGAASAAPTRLASRIAARSVHWSPGAAASASQRPSPGSASAPSPAVVTVNVSASGRSETRHPSAFPAGLIAFPTRTLPSVDRPATFRRSHPVRSSPYSVSSTTFRNRIPTPSRHRVATPDSGPAPQNPATTAPSSEATVPTH